MKDDETTVKKPMWIRSITINADNPDEAILTLIRYRKAMRLRNRLITKSGGNAAADDEKVV